MKQNIFSLAIFSAAALALVSCATSEHGMRHPAGAHPAYDDEKVFAACEAKGWTDKATPDQQK
ncbi:MAG: hypothetical protein ACXVA9_08455, partial [Bdellovibrionales bacterium]